MSVKNQLQEFFQKNGTKLPEYTYYRNGGEDHSPEWICEVEMWINGQSEIFSSDTCYSKKQASIEAAERALEALESCEMRMIEMEESKKITLKEDPSHTLILLDLENVPHGYQDLCKRVNFTDEGKASIVGFYGHTATHIKSKVLNESKRHSHQLHLIEAPSSCTDAADVAMCIWVGEMMGMISSGIKSSITEMNYHPEFIIEGRSFSLEIGLNLTRPVEFRVIIVTKDHFGKALMEIINGSAMNSAIFRAELIHSIDELVD